jgi:hypothetical protein
MKPPGASATVAGVKDLARRALDWQRRHPMATDAVVAVLFTVAGFVSVYVNLAAARDLHVQLEQPPTAAVLITTLAVTLPLAWRRRFPLSAASVVTVAFVVDRLLLQPIEPFIAVYAVWLALYSAVVYGRPARRTLVVALNVRSTRAGGRTGRTPAWRRRGRSSRSPPASRGPRRPAA